MRPPVGVCCFVAVGSWRQPALAERGQSRVGSTAIAHLSLPVHGHACIDRDRDLAAQAVERQPLGQILGRIGFAIDQHFPGGAGPYEEIEQRLALRRQQPGIGGQGSRDIIRHQPLQEGNDVFVGVFAGEADDGSVEQAGGSHG